MISKGLINVDKTYFHNCNKRGFQSLDRLWPKKKKIKKTIALLELKMLSFEETIQTYLMTKQSAYMINDLLVLNT